MRSVAFGFLTFAAMQCWASGVFGDQPASDVLELMRPFVPIELTLPLAELPPEKNAIGAALEMAKLYEPLSRYGRELELRRDNPIEKALTALTSVKDIKEKKLLDDYVNKHQALLNAFKQFVEIGDVRVSTLSEWVPIQSALRRANRVGCVRARLLLANGQ